MEISTIRKLTPAQMAELILKLTNPLNQLEQLVNYRREHQKHLVTILLMEQEDTSSAVYMAGPSDDLVKRLIECVDVVLRNCRLDPGEFISRLAAIYSNQVDRPTAREEKE